MSRLCSILAGLLVCGLASAQVDSTARQPRSRTPFRQDEITLLTGYHAGKYGSAELGIGRTIIHGHRGPGCAFSAPGSLNYHLGAEVRLDRPEVIGLKAGAYISGFIALGLQYIHYLNEEHVAEPVMEGPQSMEVLRPEFGFGGTKCKLTYAYNIALTTRMLEVSTHMLSLTYAWRVARLPGDDDHRSHRAK